MTLITSLGFSKNPFTKKSSEQELDFLDEIFFEPNYYKSLSNDLANGDSRFIIGQRGHGKSSIINKLLRDLEIEKVLTIKVDRFDSIPVRKNETALIKLILKLLVTKISIFIDNNKDKKRLLNDIEKEKLALFIRLFFQTLSKSEYEKIYDSIHKVKVRNWITRFYNKRILKPSNSITSSVIAITSSIINQSLGLDKVETGSVYKEFFGESKEIDFSKINIETHSDFNNKESLKLILDEVLLITKKIGFKNIVILFDKIDEYQELNQDISQIKDFTDEILTDTELLLNDKFAMGFSLWSELKNELAKKVRFDKFESIDIRWKENDLEPLINKRINCFSANKNLTLDSLIQNKIDKQEIIKICNKSPRDLISALANILQEQESQNPMSNSFESLSVSKGLINFSSKYDYESIYPSKVGRNKDIKTMINRLLKVRQTRFTLKHLTDTFNQRAAQSEGQIQLMIQYKLVKEDNVFEKNGVRSFDVLDPKVIFLITRGITQLED